MAYSCSVLNGNGPESVSPQRERVIIRKQCKPGCARQQKLLRTLYVPGIITSAGDVVSGVCNGYPPETFTYAALLIIPEGVSGNALLTVVKHRILHQL